MSSFNIVIDPQAEKDLKKIKRANPKLLSRLINAIDSLIHNPYKGKPLKGDKKVAIRSEKMMFTASSTRYILPKKRFILSA